MAKINLEILKGLIIIFIALAGNFISETMGCKIRKHLSESMIFKNILLFIIIYITVGYNIEDYAHPLNSLGISSIIYALFIMTMRLNIYFTLTAFFLIFTLFVIVQYRDYNIHHKKNKQIEQEINKLITLNEIVLLSTIVIGFIYYTFIQKKHYSDKFSTYTFLMGKHKCNSF